jgi:hypothetical protein
MDYRHETDRPALPPRIYRHLRKLKPVGILFMITGVLMAFLMVLKIIHSTYIFNFLSYTLMLIGPVCYLIGMVYDTYVDRSS